MSNGYKDYNMLQGTDGETAQALEREFGAEYDSVNGMLDSLNEVMDKLDAKSSNLMSMVDKLLESTKQAAEDLKKSSQEDSVEDQTRDQTPQDDNHKAEAIENVKMEVKKKLEDPENS